MDMCTVAAGNADAYYEYGIHCWDMAAGELIMSEAGGVVMDPQGKNKQAYTVKPVWLGHPSYEEKWLITIRDLSWQVLFDYNDHCV